MIFTHHPEYTKWAPHWIVLLDLYDGQGRVKDKGEVYLPPTSGMRLDGMSAGQAGRQAYDSYLMRAVLPEYVEEGVKSHMGLLHQKEPTIQLPPELEDLRDKATTEGESLVALLRRINEQQLLLGRVGLMLDFPTEESLTRNLPYIAVYNGNAIINWDDIKIESGIADLKLVVLDESGPRRSGLFGWQYDQKYRVLIMQDTNQLDTDGLEPGVYYQGIFDAAENELNFDLSKLIVPKLQGQSFDQIPFVIINSSDLTSHVKKPPLLGLANTVLAIYRGEADYRQCLFAQGQDTLVVVGGVRNPTAVGGESDAIRTGAGARIDLDIGGDAKYIGVDGSGLQETRLSLEKDYQRAEEKAGKFISTKGLQPESGEALTTRLASQTAKLNEIALTGAMGLEHILKMIAKWRGADQTKVIVTPNFEFSDFDVSGQEILYLVQARQQGAPISLKSIHDLLIDRGVTKMDFDTEVKLIKDENENLGIVPKPQPQKPVTGAPNGNQNTAG